MAEPLLDVRHLKKSYGDHLAVRDVGFEIASGETYGLLGPNGAGKTTSISMIAGILSRDGGEVNLRGKPVRTSSPEGRREIGLVPQDLALYPDLTARENLHFFGRLYGMSGGELRRRVTEVLDVIGLADRADDRVEKYSGGMKRRLNIGVGLLHSPSLLILDEPTVGVDPQSRNAILESIETLSAQGMAVLYTTHYMEEAERLCDRVGIIDEGHIEAEGTRRELVRLVGGQDVVRIEALGDLDEAARTAAALDGVASASVKEGGVQVVASGASQLLATLLQTMSAAGVSVTGVELQEPDLEAVFLHLTGKALRD